MAAVVNWEHSIVDAATETWVDTTHLRFKAANDNTNDNINPLVIPNTGTNYSFEKCLSLNVTTKPDTSLTNLRVSASLNPVHTGVLLVYGFAPAGTYSVPVGTNSARAATGTLTTTLINWDTDTTVTTTERWSVSGAKNLWLQMDIATNAVRGAIANFNVIATYDEI